MQVVGKQKGLNNGRGDQDIGIGYIDSAETYVKQALKSQEQDDDPTKMPQGSWKTDRRLKVEERTGSTKLEKGNDNKTRSRSIWSCSRELENHKRKKKKKNTVWRSKSREKLKETTAPHSERKVNEDKRP